MSDAPVSHGVRRPLHKVFAVASVFLLLSAVLFVITRKPSGSAPETPPPSAPTPAIATNQGNQELARIVEQFKALEARENELNKTLWAKETLAEQCGEVIESLWDNLNAATNKFAVLQSFATSRIVLGKWTPARPLAHGIELHEPAGAGPVWSNQDWQGFLAESERAGWQITQTEFRHTRFDTDDSGRARQSRFYFRADLLNERRQDRATLEGDLVVDWTPNAGGRPSVQQIDARGLTLKTRHGEPPFRAILNETHSPAERSFFIDPLILYDLDGDGLSEIILACKNVVYRRRGADRYEPEPLLAHSPGGMLTGIIADFDGDGAADFLGARPEGLFLFKGSAQGTFEDSGRLVWTANPRLIYGQVLTCGDINHDGSLDVFLAQYKVPYRNGQMPVPYYDANDGFPAWLLMNDGQGNFTNATASADLAAKRWRRSYSGSFVDLDGDGHLDLVVVSDFAGVDLYRNDGTGHFKEATREWVNEPHAFGMAHALADFNADGRLDLLMIGMNSPAADRLDHLNLRRPGISEDRAMRSQMAYGNRLYLARPAGGFEQTAFNDSIARSGWSWGCSAFDLDNDRFPDVYIANGMKSKKFVRDYDSEFWVHDIYIGTSQEDAVANAYYQTKFRRTLDQSYGGHEKNRLYLNQQGAAFVEAGHLFGVALGEDSRAVVTDDLDGDGRLDLLVTTYELWPETKQTLRVYKNTLDDTGNWIGFRLQEEGRGKSPIGARIRLQGPDYSAVREIVTGDSYRSQHANTVHFGLGKSDQVDRVDIKWANGRTLTLTKPAINQYHRIRMESAVQP